MNLKPSITKMAVCFAGSLFVGFLLMTFGDRAKDFVGSISTLYMGLFVAGYVSSYVYFYLMASLIFDFSNEKREKHYFALRSLLIILVSILVFFLSDFIFFQLRHYSFVHLLIK
jgi:hypothetical protein